MSIKLIQALDDGQWEMALIETCDLDNLCTLKRIHRGLNVSDKQIHELLRLMLRTVERGDV